MVLVSNSSGSGKGFDPAPVEKELDVKVLLHHRLKVFFIHERDFMFF